jgi:hypothetical protein
MRFVNLICVRLGWCRAGTRADDADRSRLAEFSLISKSRRRRCAAPLARLLHRARPGRSTQGKPGHPRPK